MKMRGEDTLTHGRLLELLSYDPKTGQFRWRKSLSNRAPVGSVAGSICGSGKYRTIMIDGLRWQAARLAWLYVHGAHPPLIVDHASRVKTDDSIGNIRLATTSQNVANTGVRSDSKTGRKGVQLRRGKYIAKIRKDGRRYWLGTFDDPDSAHRAYAAKAVELYGDFANLG